MKKYTKILSVTLAVILCLACLPFVVGAAETEATVITTEAELTTFAADVNSGNTTACAVLSADIECSEFTPIGTEENPFAGVFDGAGYSITCEYVTEGNYAGIFGYTNGAEIKNIVSDYTYFEAAKYCGGIVGYAVNTVISGCTVDEAYLLAESNLGGIAGYASECTIENAVILSNSTIEASGLYCGGIVGEASDTTVNVCINNAPIKAKSYAAGITATATDCNITNCANTGAVSVEGDYCAGIVDTIDGGKVVKCYNSGSVKAPLGKIYSGIFGVLSSGEVSCCYNVGSLSGSLTKYAGVGVNVAGTVSNCYCANTAPKTFLSTVSGSATITSCKRLAVADMKSETVFAGFDFENDWEFITGHSYDYPVLKALSYHTLTFVSTTAPGCTTKGFDSYACKKCGAVIKMNFVEAKGHNYKTVELQKATCLEAGYAEFECENCLDTYTEDYEATGHTDADSNNKCDVCGVKIDESIEDEEELNIFQKIIALFQKIINWVKKLFSK